MSSFAKPFRVSHAAVSAVFREPPRAKENPRDRLLRPLLKHGRRLAGKAAPRGVIVVLYVKSGKSRGRAALARHHAIVRAARESSRRLGYGINRLVLAAGELPSLSGLLRERGCRGLLILPGPEPEVLRRIPPPFLSCVYADIPAAELLVDAVSPDYSQSIFVALGRLRAAGLNKPGLVLDDDLPLPAREHLIHSYGLGLSAAGIPVAPPFFIPTRSSEPFATWFRKNAFDSLLATDPEYARRLAPARKLPVFDLDFNLPAVGRLAVEKLLFRPRGPAHSKS